MNIKGLTSGKLYRVRTDIKSELWELVGVFGRYADLRSKGGNGARWVDAELLVPHEPKYITRYLRG